MGGRAEACLDRHTAALGGHRDRALQDLRRQPHNILLQREAELGAAHRGRGRRALDRHARARRHVGRRQPPQLQAKPAVGQRCTVKAAQLLEHNVRVARDQRAGAIRELERDRAAGPGGNGGTVAEQPIHGQRLPCGLIDMTDPGWRVYRDGPRLSRQCSQPSNWEAEDATGRDPLRVRNPVNGL